MTQNYSNTILKITREYAGTRFQLLVDEATDAYVRGDYKKIDEVVKMLPNDLQLLEALVEKLQGKSVYTNLQKLLEGKETSTEQAIISTASLITHVAIDLKEGHKEYRKLMPSLYAKLGVLINKL
jgi:hypothetical protein